MSESKIRAVLPGPVAAFVLVVLMAGSAPAAVDGEALEKKLEKVAAYGHGDSRAPLKELERIVTEATTDEDAAAQVADRLAAVLADEEATDAGRAYVCRQLWMVATADQVPALGELLDHERLAHMARYALQQMEAPEAGKALRDALDRLEGERLVGVIHSIGERGDRGAVGKLAGLVEHEDAQVAGAAATALGKIGGRRAGAAIVQARSGATGATRRNLTDAYLRCADGFLERGDAAAAVEIYQRLQGQDEPVRIQLAVQRGLAATKGAGARGMLVKTAQDAGRERVLRVAAVRQLQRLDGDGVTDAMADLIEQVGSELRPEVLNALGARGDRAAEGAVADWARRRDADKPVRSAAVEALARVGTADSVKMLAGIAAEEQGDLRRVARRSLSRLAGPGVNGAIVKAIDGADEARRVELVRALGERRAAGSVEALLKLAADDPAEAVRRGVVSVIERYGSAEALGPLAKRLTAEPSDAVREAVVEAIVSIAERTGAKAQARELVLKARQGAEGGGHIAAIKTLGRLGGEKALKAVRKDVDHESSPVRAAAIRALADWPDASALPALWELSGSAQQQKHRWLALQGHIRLIGVSDKPAGKKVELYRRAIDRADRPNEKKQAISALAEIAHPEALKLAEELAEDPDVQSEAEQAAKAIREKLDQ